MSTDKFTEFASGLVLRYYMGNTRYCNKDLMITDICGLLQKFDMDAPESGIENICHQVQKILMGLKPEYIGGEGYVLRMSDFDLDLKINKEIHNFLGVDY